MSHNLFMQETLSASDFEESLSFKKKVAIERGRRIKLTRTLLNISRKEMLERYDINPNTLNAWENGTNCLTEKGAEKLSEAFSKEGTLIKKEWLLFGERPEFVNETPESKIRNQELKSIFGLREDLKVLVEIDYFKNQNANAIATIISDEALSPLFKPGDYVGGIILPSARFKELVGEFCIINTDEEGTFVRKIVIHKEKNVFVVGGINPFAKLNEQDYMSCKINLAAQITRHWRLHGMVNSALF